MSGARAVYAAVLWQLSHGHDSFSDMRAALGGIDHERLADLAANTVLNDWCSDAADYRSTEARDTHGWGKRIPYIGWYWRSVDFARKRIPIGDCGDFIGFMESNKWGHPERDLTDSEADQVLALLWRARAEDGRGGSIAETDAARDQVLSELWDLMQSFEVPS